MAAAIHELPPRWNSRALENYFRDMDLTSRASPDLRAHVVGNRLTRASEIRVRNARGRSRCPTPE